MREANPEVPDGGLERTVVRVEGMDCESCAATVERRAVVNFVAADSTPSTIPASPSRRSNGPSRTPADGGRGSRSREAPFDRQ